MRGAKRPGRPRSDGPWLLLSLGVVTATLLASPGAAALHPSAGVRTAIEPWSEYDTGRVNVVYPSALPIVQLIQDANSSLSATLAITGVYEVDPTGVPTPTVVAAAFPSIATAFNGSPAPGGADSPFSMFANLAVYPVGLPLWAPSTALGPTAAPVGGATLAVAFGPAPGTSATAGVLLNWTVSGWPWVAPTDDLAVAFTLAFDAADSLIACTAAPLLVAPPPGCGGSAVGSATGTWGNGFRSLESSGGAGPVAVLSWSPSFGWGSTLTPVTMGALTTNPGSASVLLMGPNGGTAPSTGSLSFALVAPVTILHSLLAGDPVAYLAALVGLTAAVAAGLVAYRRHARRVVADL